MLLFQLARVSSIDKWSSFYKGKKFHKFTPNRMRPKPSSHYRDIGDGKPPPRLNTGSEDVGGGEIPENFDNSSYSIILLNNFLCTKWKYPVYLLPFVICVL